MRSLFNATTTIVSPYWNAGKNFHMWAQSIGDKRTQGWLMVDSPLPTIVWIVFYLALVAIGPKVMKNKRPFSLKRTMMAYNLFMTLTNVYISSQLLVSSTRLGYSYVCQPLLSDNFAPDELRLAAAVWWFYLTKIVEFCDTLFFILRKKENQLSFLHVYHHASVLAVWWYLLKVAPTGSTFVPTMTNSMVHVVMYSYYFLAACGPKVAKYLWWKRYLTVLQLIQFVWALYSAGSVAIFDCGYPARLSFYFSLYMLPFLALFTNFYAKTYFPKRRSVRSESDSKRGDCQVNPTAADETKTTLDEKINREKVKAH